jgi:hypothetical protein
VKRRQFLGITAALGAAAATGGCGVPSGSDPVRLGQAPTPGPQQAVPRKPPAPAEATTAKELVENYLKAAAGANYTGGDRPNALTDAQQWARSYLTDSKQRLWQPSKELTVVRVQLGGTQPAGNGAFTVPAVLNPLGVLNDRGDIEPSPAAQIDFTFTVVQVGTEFRLDDAPPSLFLSDNGLQTLYSDRHIYFWDQADQPTLVPDQRYLPTSIADAKQPVEIVRWLTTGPAPWLQPIVQLLPPEIEVKDTSFDAGRLIVNLSSKAATLDKDTLRRLAVQLRWSANPGGGVELRIEGTSAGVSADDYLTANLAVHNDDNGEPEQFCVLNRKARPVKLASGSPTPILTSDQNSEVVLAAVPRKKRNAALVRIDGRNQRLWLGSLIGGGDVQAAVYAPTNLVGAKFSRPVWISRPATQALVAADGHLYCVSAPPAGSNAMRSVTPVSPLPRGLPGPVTALSVSPEGRRIALVAGGEVIVAPLLFGDELGIADSFRVVKTDLGDQRAVGWSDETKLIVGGSPMAGTKSTLVEVGIDSTGQQPVPRSPDGSESLVVSLLAVRPASPIPAGVPALTMFDANGAAYNVYNQQVKALPVDSVGPSGSPPAQPAESARPAAPFFLD